MSRSTNLKKSDNAVAQAASAAGPQRARMAADIPVGVGLRLDLIDDIEARLAAFDVVEILVDQYLDATAYERRRVEEICRHVPAVVHGVRLSLGTTEAPDAHYLDRVAAVIDRLGALHYSEHVAFCRAGGMEVDELLPVPLNEASLDTMSRNVEVMRKRIDCPLLLENVPSAFVYGDSTLSYGEFADRLCRRTGSKLLLDLENAYSDEVNWGNSAAAFVGSLAPGSVAAIHLAGGTWHGTEYVDDHSADAPEPVLALVTDALAKSADPMIIVERDRGYDGLATFEREVRRVRDRLSVPGMVDFDAVVG
jgi:uncharacterized protein (UPF0276 family)